MSGDDNRQIARRALEALMAGDLGALREVLAPDAVLHQCGFLQPIPAGQIVNGRFPGRSRVRDREIRIERIVCEGDMVALHWRTSGAYADPAEPDLHGEQVSFSSMSFLRIEGGRIAEIWNIQDTSTLQTQLSQASHARDTE